MNDAPCPTPETTPWWRSKRLLMFGLMFVARVVPVVWHNPAVKDICDWLLNAAVGGGAYFSTTSYRRITLHDERPAQPPIGPLNPQP